MKEAKDKTKKKRLEDVLIVRDFLEVFPKDLPGIPPAQQIEFQIDLVPCVAPVAWAPYWLPPSEMKELAEQLQELSDKGFIRPSSSPWGASVLFVKKKDESFHPNKIEAVKNWKALESPTEKHKKYVWGDEQKVAFQTLKDKLCKAHVLALSDGLEDFMVYCDASCQGLG
nr:putative reverse transcriptase domain-containing protein [Tanacetum cinerariifolium]